MISKLDPFPVYLTWKIRFFIFAWSFESDIFRIFSVKIRSEFSKLIQNPEYSITDPKVTQNVIKIFIMSPTFENRHQNMDNLLVKSANFYEVILFQKIESSLDSENRSLEQLSKLRNEFANLESQDREDYQGRVNRSSTIHC